MTHRDQRRARRPDRRAAPGVCPDTAIKLVFGAALIAVAGPAGARADDLQDRPDIKNFRYQEDWSPLRDPAARVDPLDRLKFVPLNADGSAYVTFGGELRERFESVHDAGFGLDTPAKDAYLPQRASVFADAHLGPHVRTFIELTSGLVR